MKTSFRTGLLMGLGLFASAVAGVTFFRGSFGLADDTLACVRRTGTLRIGYAVEAPYAFLGTNGEVTGESPEVARRIASRLGATRIVWRQTEFDELIPELEAGRIDLIAAGMVVTPERAARVCFSDPTFAVRPGLLVPKGNPLRLCPRLCSASNALVRVAVLSGSIEERAFNEQTPGRCQRVVVPDARTGRVAVETGAADAFALSAPSVRWMARTDRSGATECVVSTNADTDAQVTTGYGAFAFRKDDARLVAAWNRQQRAFVGSAEHAALLSRFGFLRDEVCNLGKKGAP